MHSGFGAASGTIHLLPKGLAMPCGWLLGHGQIPAPSIYHPGWLLGQKSAATYPPTASPTAGWGGGKQISPEDPLLIYKLGQHRVKTTVKYKDHLIQGKGKLPEGHTKPCFNFFFLKSKKICLKKKKDNSFPLTCCQRKQTVKMTCEDTLHLLIHPPPRAEKLSPIASVTGKAHEVPEAPLVGHPWRDLAELLWFWGGGPTCGPES